MKRYILFFAAAAACVASCDRVMDLTPPEKGPVDYDMVEFSLYESGTYDYYLDNPMRKRPQRQGSMSGMRLISGRIMSLCRMQTGN